MVDGAASETALRAELDHWLALHPAAELSI